MNKANSTRLLTSSQWTLRSIWLGYAVFLFIMTHAPIPQPVVNVTSMWDKPIHFGAYFVLSTLTCLVCLQRNPFRVSHAIIIPSLILFAAFDEVLQGPFGRTPDVKDWLCDCLGIFVVASLAQAGVWFMNRSLKQGHSLWFFQSAETKTSRNTNGFAQ